MSVAEVFGHRRHNWSQAICRDKTIIESLYIPLSCQKKEDYWVSRELISKKRCCIHGIMYLVTRTSNCTRASLLTRRSRGGINDSTTRGGNL